MPYRPAIVLLACTSLWVAPAAANPVLKAQSQFLDAEIDGKLDLERFTLGDGRETYEATLSVAPGERRRMCVISGTKRHCETLTAGARKDLTVVVDGKRYPFAMIAIPPAADFSAEHARAFDGKNSFVDPPVYEMVNIAIALTESAQANQWLVHPGVYRDQVQAYFAPMGNHPFVKALNARMAANQLAYFTIKMSGYGYDMDADGHISRSPVYSSTSFEDYPNALADLESEMQSFATDSHYRDFYTVNRPWYAQLEKTFAERVDIPQMNDWLRSNFPAVKPYNHINVVFSPLVYSSQSTTRMESNGFREAQLHMNFPFWAEANDKLSMPGKLLHLGMLTFTELNHNYINPTADNYAADIATAFAAYPRERGKTTSMYADRLSYFNEMMNWGLINLFVLDKGNPEDTPIIREQVRQIMTDNRGFTQFAEFDDFLVPLYANRAQGSTLADLYPQIIAWFAAHPAEPGNGDDKTPA